MPCPRGRTSGRRSRARTASRRRGASAGCAGGRCAGPGSRRRRRPGRCCAPVERSTSPVFAGAYYRDRHIDRQRSLQMLLDAAMPFGLEIYDRRFGHEDKAFGFPERFTERVKGALPYDQMINAYKAHRIFLNGISMHDSPTMFSRRVFELLACGTAVVSTESVGVEQTPAVVGALAGPPDQATEPLGKPRAADTWAGSPKRGWEGRRDGK